jgi:hypothetical protein
LYAKVDEEIVADGDFIESTDTQYCELGLQDVLGPDSGDVKVYVRARKKNENDSALNIKLMEGATVRAEWTESTSLTTSFQTFSYTLSQGERDAVTDWTNLRVRLARV